MEVSLTFNSLDSETAISKKIASMMESKDIMEMLGNQLKHGISVTGDKIIRDLFGDGKYFRDNPGPFYLLLKDKIEERLLSEEFQAIIMQMFEAKLKVIAEKATDEAALHVSKKITFNALKQIETKET